MEGRTGAARVYESDVLLLDLPPGTINRSGGPLAVLSNQGAAGDTTTPSTRTQPLSITLCLAITTAVYCTVCALCFVVSHDLVTFTLRFGGREVGTIKVGVWSAYSSTIDPAIAPATNPNQPTTVSGYTCDGNVEFWGGETGLYLQSPAQWTCQLQTVSATVGVASATAVLVFASFPRWRRTATVASMVSAVCNVGCIYCIMAWASTPQDSQQGQAVIWSAAYGPLFPVLCVAEVFGVFQTLVLAFNHSPVGVLAFCTRSMEAMNLIPRRPQSPYDSAPVTLPIVGAKELHACDPMGHPDTSAVNWHKELIIETRRNSLILWEGFRRIMLAIGLYFVTSAIVAISAISLTESATNGAPWPGQVSAELGAAVINLIVGLGIITMFANPLPPDSRKAFQDEGLMGWQVPSLRDDPTAFELRVRPSAEVGLGIQLGVTNGTVRVIRVELGAPGDVVGLAVGDSIISVDGVVLTEQVLNDPSQNPLAVGGTSILRLWVRREQDRSAVDQPP